MAGEACELTVIAGFSGHWWLHLSWHERVWAGGFSHSGRQSRSGEQPAAGPGLEGPAHAQEMVSRRVMGADRWCVEEEQGHQGLPGVELGCER